MDELFEKIRSAFEDFEEDELQELVSQALDEGADPSRLIALLSGILEGIGKQFSEGTMFLPDMVMAGDQMEQCMDIIRPALQKNAAQTTTLAKVVLGSVAGDDTIFIVTRGLESSKSLSERIKILLKTV